MSDENVIPINTRNLNTEFPVVLSGGEWAILLGMARMALVMTPGNKPLAEVERKLSEQTNTPSPFSNSSS